MRLIAHLSDLHFGTEDPAIAAELLAELDGERPGTALPSLVVVSGDLTQRARVEQFRSCRAWLDRLRSPLLVVPGNHDVPLYQLAERLLHPFDRYQRLIGPELEPTYHDEELAVAGVNTVDPHALKDGRVTRAQAAAVCAELARHDPRAIRIVVAHHPFVLPAGRPERERVDGADAALPMLAAAGVSLVLSGHLHIAYTSDVAGFRSDDHAVVAVHAGTCMSTRRRGEPNGYNRLFIDGERLLLVHRVWDGQRFADGASKRYRREADGNWRRADEAPAWSQLASAT